MDIMMFDSSLLVRAQKTSVFSMFSSASSCRLRRAAADDQALAQLLGQHAAACVAALDHLHRVLVLQPLGQACPDVAAAGDHDALVGLVDAAQLGHHLADVLARRDEEHLVVGLDHRVALGDDRPVAGGRSPRRAYRPWACARGSDSCWPTIGPP
jgi:hypothetical protein